MAYAPGMGTPEPGGMTPRELFPMLRGVAAANNVVGVEIAISFWQSKCSLAFRLTRFPFQQTKAEPVINRRKGLLALRRSGAYRLFNVSGR